MELEESTCLTSDYNTKLQSSRQYGTGAKKKYRSMEQNRKPWDNPCIYGHLIFDKEGKNIQWRKDHIFNKCSGKTGQPIVKEWNLNTS